MRKSGNNFQNGETSLHAKKNDKVEPKKPTTKNVIHQQNKNIKPKGAFTSRISFSPMVGGSSFRRRIKNSFSPLMDKIECFNYHNFGHVAADCRKRMHTSM